MRQFLRSIILALVHIVGAPGVRSAQRRAKRARQALTEPRILLVRPDHLGDMVMVTPILHALKKQAPDAHITMMVGPWSREIVARHPAVDAVITCEFPGFQRATQAPLAPYTLLLKTARQLRTGSYDMALNLRPDFWWGAALLYLARIPRRLGYAIQPGTLFLTKALASGAHEHATVSNLRLASTGLQALGYAALTEPYTPERYPEVFDPTAEEEHWVTTRLEQAGIMPEMPIIVIHPGTGADVKLWRSKAWAHVADTLSQATLFAQPPRVILSGSPQERALLEEIAQGMQAKPVLLSDMSVGQLAALLKRASLVLGVDSGPLHLAVPHQHPTVRIFGPTDARIFGPWGDPRQHRVIAATQRCPTCACIPCGRLDFAAAELAEHPCVKLVSDEQVIKVVSQLVPTQNNMLP